MWSMEGLVATLHWTLPTWLLIKVSSLIFQVVGVTLAELPHVWVTSIKMAFQMSSHQQVMVTALRGYLQWDSSTLYTESLVAILHWICQLWALTKALLWMVQMSLTMLDSLSVKLAISTRMGSETSLLLHILLLTVKDCQEQGKHLWSMARVESDLHLHFVTIWLLTWVSSFMAQTLLTIRACQWVLQAISTRMASQISSLELHMQKAMLDNQTQVESMWFMANKVATLPFSWKTWPPTKALSSMVQTWMIILDFVSLQEATSTKMASQMCSLGHHMEVEPMWSMGREVAILH